MGILTTSISASYILYLHGPGVVLVINLLTFAPQQSAPVTNHSGMSCCSGQSVFFHAELSSSPAPHWVRQHPRPVCNCANLRVNVQESKGKCVKI